MSKKPNASPGAGQVEARVLATGRFGAVNEVVTVGAPDAESGVACGELDTSPAAVAYAKSLVVEDPPA